MYRLWYYWFYDWDVPKWLKFLTITHCKWSFLVFSPFVRLNKIGRCFKQVSHQAVMTTMPTIPKNLHKKAHKSVVGGTVFKQHWVFFFFFFSLFVLYMKLTLFNMKCNNICKLVLRCSVYYMWVLLKNKATKCGLALLSSFIYV